MTYEQVMGATLVAYLLLLLGIGTWAQRRVQSESDFYLGGRRIGPWIAAIGASATSSSAWTLLGVSGLAYSSGLKAVWLFPGCVGGFALNWFLIAPALQRHSHRTGAMTLIEVLAGPAGTAMRRAVVVLASFIVLASLGVYVASQFHAAGKLFHDLFHIPAWQAVVGGGAAIVVYTWMGGFWAVSVTDTVQGLMMALTALILPIAALISVGGFAALGDALQDVPVAHFLSASGGASWDLAALGMVLGFLGIGLGYPGQPHVAKFFLALERDPKSVRSARRVALLWACVVYAGMILLGLCGRALIESMSDGEVVLVRVARDLFPAAISGVMVAAVLSAMMSTADSQLLVAASTVTHDLTPSISKSNVLLRSRVVIMVLTMAAVIAALSGEETIFNRVLFAWGAMGAAFGPLLIAKVVMKRRVSSQRAFAAMAVGFLWSVLAYFFHKTWFPSPPGSSWGLVHRGIVPFLAAFLIAVVGTNRQKTGTSASPNGTIG